MVMSSLDHELLRQLRDLLRENANLLRLAALSRADQLAGSQEFRESEIRPEIKRLSRELGLPAE